MLHAHLAFSGDSSFAEAEEDEKGGGEEADNEDGDDGVEFEVE